MLPRPRPKREYCRRHGREYNGYVCPECMESRFRAKLENQSEKQLEKQIQKEKLTECPKCHKISLWYNRSKNKNECLNRLCLDYYIVETEIPKVEKQDSPDSLQIKSTTVKTSKQKGIETAKKRALKKSERETKKEERLQTKDPERKILQIPLQSKPSSSPKAVMLCPLCKQTSLWFNSFSGEYECQNIECKASGKSLQFLTSIVSKKKEEKLLMWSLILIGIVIIAIGLWSLFGTGLSLWLDLVSLP